MFEYFDLDKDEMIYSSKIFYKIIPIFIFVRIFIFLLFEVVFRCYTKKYSSTYNTLSEKLKQEWTSKATSVFHAILVTVLCIPHTLTDIIYRKSNKDLAFGITKRRVDVLLWTLAYLIYDSCMMIRIHGKKISKEMVLHHIVCMTAFILGLYLNVGTVFMASFLINEISTPFLHFRWYFSRMKKRDTTIAYINNLTFAFTYVVFRGIWNTYVFYVLCRGFYEFRDGLHGNPVPFWVIACLPPFALSHLLLNYYWLYLILLHIIHPKPRSEEASDASSPASPASSASSTTGSGALTESDLAQQEESNPVGSTAPSSKSSSSKKSKRGKANAELEGISINQNSPSFAREGSIASSANSSVSSLNSSKAKEDTPLLKKSRK